MEKMEKPKRIGFLQKWNPEAKRVEWSLTSLQMLMMGIFSKFFMWRYFVVDKTPITSDELILVLILLTGTYFPKLLRNFIESQELIQLKKKEEDKNDNEKANG